MKKVGKTAGVGMETIGRFLMLAGILILLMGGLIFLFTKLGIPLGQLPGDIRIVGKKGSFYFPLTTCILISLILSGILAVITRLFRK
jgi:hypothetical protein